jgi:hypothetical protein
MTFGSHVMKIQLESGCLYGTSKKLALFSRGIDPQIESKPITSVSKSIVWLHLPVHQSSSAEDRENTKLPDRVRGSISLLLCLCRN